MDEMDDNITGSGGHSHQPRMPAVTARSLQNNQLANNWLANDETDFQDSIDLRKYWFIIYHRKWTVLIFLAIVVIAGMASTYLTTPIYRASTTLQLDQEETRIVDYQQIQSDFSAITDTQEYMSTMQEVLQSHRIAQRVASEMDPREYAKLNWSAKKPWHDLLPWRQTRAMSQPHTPGSAAELAAQTEAAASAIQGNVRVEPVANSRILRVSFNSPDAKFAADVANKIASVFISVNLERRLQATSYAKNFLQDRLQQVQAKLEDSEKALVDFQRKQELIKVDSKGDDGVSLNTRALESYGAALTQAQQERIKSESLYDSLQGSAIEGLAEFRDNKVILGLKERKNSLEAAYQEGLKIYKPAYPKMLQLKGQIDETQKAIDAEVQDVRSEITARYRASLEQEKALMAKLLESKRNILSDQDRSIEYNILKREVDTNRQLYDGLLQRLKEVGVAGGIGTNNISVLDMANVPGGPYTPNPDRNLMYSVFLGLVGGIALAFLFDHLDDTFKRTEDVEKTLGLPVLGIVPLAGSGGHEKLYQENLDARSHFSEAYRSLRTALQFSTPSGTPKVLMATSSSLGEGKSTTALSLAVQIAQTGKKVLLIDGDMRRACLHEELKLEGHFGLTNYLAGDAKPLDISQSTSVPNLYVIPSGPLPPNPVELINSTKMVALINLAAEKFDQVIVDGPPILGLADAPLLGSIADAAIMVIETGKTTRNDARAAIKRLQSTHTHVIGAVMTKMRSHGYGENYYAKFYYYDYASTEKPGAGKRA